MKKTKYIPDDELIKEAHDALSYMLAGVGMCTDTECYCGPSIVLMHLRTYLQERGIKLDA